jgi:hypothetical protein
MIDLEIALIERFGWSPHEIDESNVESLIPLINKLSGNQKQPLYCDETDWGG